MNARLKIIDTAGPPASSPEPEARAIAAGWTLAQLMEQTHQLQARGQFDQADQAYRAWLGAHPGDRVRHAALFNHASVLQALQQPEAAMAAYRECMEIAPSFGEAYVNLGLLLERLGQIDPALQVWSQYLGQRMLKGHVDVEMQCTTLNHIGRVQESQKRYDLAERALRESLALRPKQPGVIQHWVHVRQKACQWPVYEPLPGLTVGELQRATSPLAMLALTDDPQLQLMTAQRFVSRTYPFTEDVLHDRKRRPGARWRVGLVSADLREHAVGFLLPAFIQGVDSKCYELFAYDYTPAERTPLRRRLEGLFHHVRNISALSDRQAAELIARDQIDILIDLHGLSSGARPGIFALHPAPHQATYLGYIGSTGMPWFDHVIVDPQVMPAELAEHFTEQPLHLSSSFIPLTHEAPSDLPVSREQAGLPAQGFVMAAFGNVYKITPEMFACWMRCLQRIEGSVLWLIDDNPLTTRNLKMAALAQGVDPARLVFAPRCAPALFRAQLRLADVYLDSYPYNCGSTSNDVVNAEVPLVSLYGRTLVSRMGLSILTELGQPDLAVSSHAAYEDKVLEVALRTRAGHRYAYRRRIATAPLMEALDQIRQGRLQCARASAMSTTAPGTPVQCLPWPLAPEQAAGLDAAPAWLQEWHAFESVERQLLLQPLNDQVLYVLDSPAWQAATGMSAARWLEPIGAAAEGCDAVVLASEWEAHSLSRNPWTALADLHPEWLGTAQQVLDRSGMNMEITQALWPAQKSLRGLTLAARKPVWLAWLALAQRLRHWSLACETALGQALAQKYALGTLEVSAAQLMHSLLMNLVLADERWKTQALETHTLPGRHAPSDRALQGNALKLAAMHTSSHAYVQAFERLRQPEAIRTGNHTEADAEPTPKNPNGA